MSYSLQSIPRASVQRNVTEPARVTGTKARANGGGLQPRGLAQAVETEPSFIRAIASELSKIEGRRIEDHLAGARQLLEEAFRAVEQKNGLAALYDASPHAA